MLKTTFKDGSTLPYLGPAPCAAACAPFKSSPGTYATCCKQHAATAAAAPKPALKPTAVKPGVLKSRFPKPLTTGQLQQGQVTKVGDNLDLKIILIFLSLK